MPHGEILQAHARQERTPQTAATGRMPFEPGPSFRSFGREPKSAPGRKFAQRPRSLFRAFARYTFNLEKKVLSYGQ